MSAVEDQRSLIFTQETDYRSAVSEAVFTKTAANINHIHNRQIFYKEFNLNGDYRTGVGIQGFDGIFPILFPFEIVSISIGNVVPGTGKLDLDVRLLRGSNNDLGSIFTTRPSIESTAAAPALPNTYGMVQLTPSRNESPGSTGLILPVLDDAITNTNKFEAFDALRVDIVSVMSGASNANLIIGYRPR